MALFDTDPEGNLRSIPVRLGDGRVVWMSRAEHARLMKGVDPLAAQHDAPLCTDDDEYDQRWP